MITSIEENIRDRGGDGDNRTYKRKVEVGNAEHGRIADVESAKEPDVESVKETGIAVVKPFTYSEEGLLRLIRLDLGILIEKELDTNCKTVGNSLDYNIKSEEMFDPPSKKLQTYIPIDCAKVKGVDTEKVLASPGRRIQTPKSADSAFMKRFSRKEKEMESVYRKTTEKRDDEEREYVEGEERKKVMGMSDIHLVSVYVY